MIGVALVEDDPLFCDTVTRALEQSDDIVLQSCAQTLAQGLALLAGPPANVLVVDLGLPDGSGIDMIRAARRAWPDCAVMVTTLFGDEERVFAAFAAGATGYLLKDTVGSTIASEIRVLHAGGSPISPMIARQLLRHFQTAPMPTAEAASLSSRELQVLKQITLGCSVAEIAEYLAVSPWTVQTYVRRIYEKLGVSSKAAAVSTAYQLGLVNAW